SPFFLRPFPLGSGDAFRSRLLSYSLSRSSSAMMMPPSFDRDQFIQVHVERRHRSLRLEIGGAGPYRHVKVAIRMFSSVGQLLSAPTNPTWCNLESSRRKNRKSTRLNSSHVKISYAVFC